MNYIKGSHNLKVGMQMQQGHFTRNDSNHELGDYYILSVNGSTPPFHVGLPTITSPLAGWTDRLNYNLGFYAPGFVDAQAADLERGSPVRLPERVG